MGTSEYWKKFEEELKEKALQAEARMQPFLPKDVSGDLSNDHSKKERFTKTLAEAMNYSFLSGGKRLRPVIMRETGLLFGRESSVMDHFMAMIEMIHTYSLIHDDLPAMDDDDYRRGRKTTHVVYGEAMGILAGDALLNLAFETGIRALQNHADPGDLEAGIKSLAVIGERAGIYGMVGGQAQDVEWDGRIEAGAPTDDPEELLEYIHSNKTAALLEASMMAGAILSGASEDEVGRIERAAHAIGIAFQIRDDILDVKGDRMTLGKPIGSDAKNGKLTYVSLYGMEASEKKVEELTGEALDIITSFPRRNPFLEDLIKYLAGREK